MIFLSKAESYEAMTPDEQRKFNRCMGSAYRPVGPRIDISKLKIPLLISGIVYPKN